MKLKTPQQIADNAKSAKVIELSNHIELSRVILQFENDPVQYGLSFLPDTYCEWIEDNKLNRLVMDRPLVDDTHIELIQYEYDAPVKDVMEEKWCITECLKTGMPFSITEVWDTYKESELKSVEVGVLRMYDLLIREGLVDENTIATLHKIDLLNAAL